MKQLESDVEMGNNDGGLDPVTSTEQLAVDRQQKHAGPSPSGG